MMKTQISSHELIIAEVYKYVKCKIVHKLSLCTIKIRARFTCVRLVYIYYVQLMFSLSFRLHLVLTLNRLLITYSRFFPPASRQVIVNDH